MLINDKDNEQDGLTLYSAAITAVFTFIVKMKKKNSPGLNINFIYTAKAISKIMGNCCQGISIKLRFDRKL